MDIEMIYKLAAFCVLVAVFVTHHFVSRNADSDIDDFKGGIE